jgi:hypothetical protein
MVLWQAHNLIARLIAERNCSGSSLPSRKRFPDFRVISTAPKPETL